MTAIDSFDSAELIKRVDFTPDLALFRFHIKGKISFTAGQYATLAVEDAGRLIQRPYSIASAPSEPYLEFFIELVPGGMLTPKLWDLRLKDQVLVRKRIVGDFTLDGKKSNRRRHLMVATVTGIAPFVSIVRTEHEERKRGQPLNHKFLIIHGASRSWELGDYRNELAELSREGWLTYIPTVSRPAEDKDWKGEVGRVEDVLRKYADMLEFDQARTVAYASGHPQMIENVKGILARARFTEEQIKEEKYFIAED